MAQEHNDTKPLQLFLKSTQKKKKVWHQNGIIYKLLPSVSKDKSHPQADDEVTRLITGGKFI